MKRLSSRFGIALGLILLLPGVCQARQAPTGHFHFAGPMSSFMLNGATPGYVTSDLPFTLTSIDKGASISRDRFVLKAKGWTGSATLFFDGLKHDSGSLKAIVHLQNGSGSVLEGVRLDIVGATEEHKALDANGKEILKTRAKRISFASPLLFGDVAVGQEAD